MRRSPISNHGYAEVQDADTAYPSQVYLVDSAESLKPIDEADAPDPPNMPDDDALPLGKAIKKYPKVAVYGLGLSLVVIGWGYAGTVIGDISSVESFQKDYGHIFNGKPGVPTLWLSLWGASAPIGMTLGSVFAGWFPDYAGRRMSFFAGSAMSAIGCGIVLTSIFSKDLELKRALLFVGMIIQGMATGNLKITAMTFISEIAPPSLRGSIMALIPTGNLIGQLLGFLMLYLINGVEGKSSYLSAFGSQFAMAVAPFIMACFMSESPAFLEEKGQHSKAVRAAEKIYAPRVDHMQALQKIRGSIEKEKANHRGATFAACFVGTNRRRTLIVIMANLFPVMFGLDLLSKASYFLQTIGMKSSVSLLFMIGGILAGIAANAAGVWVQSRVGRRPSSLTSMSLAALLWTFMGVVGIWKGPTIALVISIILICIIIVCGLGCWPAGYAIMSETSSLMLRAKTQAIGGISQQITAVAMSFALPPLFNTDAAALGGKTGFLFTGLTTLAVILCFFFLPETKGREQIEIDHMFEMQLPARKFRHWKADEELSKMNA
jgi:MFS family permease